MLLFLVRLEGKAQEITNDTITYHIKTKDGNQYFGKILSRKDGVIEFQSTNIGKVFIYEQEVEFIEEYNPNKKIWDEHFQSSYYFLFPSGYGLKKGEGSYQNIWILFNTVNYGVSDYFSIGAGTIPIFLFGSSTIPVWITPKLSIPISKDFSNVTFGSIIVTGGGDVTGFGYGQLTLGSRNANLSLGFSNNIFGDFTGSFFMLSGSLRVGEKFYLLTENYVQDDDSFMLLGGRAMIGRSSIEFGIARDNDWEFIGIPILGVTLPLHKE
ncbi:MAG: hypothetical protein Tsb0034_30270 [Ekhidna sp.]